MKQNIIFLQTVGKCNFQILQLSHFHAKQNKKKFVRNFIFYFERSVQAKHNITDLQSSSKILFTIFFKFSVSKQYFDFTFIQEHF